VRMHSSAAQQNARMRSAIALAVVQSRKRET